MSKKKLPVDRRITKRFKNLSNVKARLLDVTLKAECSLETCSQRDMRLRSIRILLNQIETNDHLMVPQAMAYRSDPSNSFSAKEDKRDFYRRLQDVLQCSRASLQLTVTPSSSDMDQSEGFLYESTLYNVRKVSTIHVDLMPIIQQSASPTMENTTIGKTIYKKVARYLSVYADVENFPKVREFHIHLDVAEFLSLQRIQFMQKSSTSAMGSDEDQMELQRGNNDIEEDVVAVGVHWEQEAVEPVLVT